MQSSTYFGSVCSCHFFHIIPSPLNILPSAPAISCGYSNFQKQPGLWKIIESLPRSSPEAQRKDQEYTHGGKWHSASSHPVTVFKKMIREQVQMYLNKKEQHNKLKCPASRINCYHPRASCILSISPLALTTPIFLIFKQMSNIISFHLSITHAHY